MNIFEKEADVFGGFSPSKIEKSSKHFYRIVKKIKKQLSENSYKLDKYLGILLEAINCKLNEDAAMDGFSVYSELRGICLSILGYEEKEKYQEHEFYKTAKELMEMHKFPYKERHTLLELYCALLTPKFATFVAKKYAKGLKRRAKAVFDIVELWNCYEDLVNEVGDLDMNRLNEAVKKLFIICPVMKSYLKSLSNNYLYCLLRRDLETSMQVFQLLTEVNKFGFN